MLKRDVTIKNAVKQAIASRKTELEEHPALETLVAFRSELLERDEAQRIREHLGLCRECAELLLFHASRSEGTTKHLKQLERWLLNQPARVIQSTRDLLASSITMRRAGPLYLAAIAVLVAPSYLLLWKTRSHIDELTQPKVGAVIVDVQPETRSIRASPSSEKTQVDLGLEDHSFTLIFPPQQGNFKAYSLRLLDAENGEIWRTEELEVDKHRTATITLWRGYIKEPGLYRVEISHPEATWPPRIYPFLVNFEK